ncbi:hypothetical protein LTR78_005787 [Recurvomyces mirabilis]|uniref:Uncharacterized protein n=1 Tax=Recurvomyces mirabilis TaxID=574656 RepID=A0AAE1C0Y8_9PEZI|nr:hypothetical protein LTR78_005787 [Recurvomyces mirabilis]KAK5154167.1 hypothetical protein LTS14_006852 [Recurvomyces mirabilis]
MHFPNLASSFALANTAMAYISLSSIPFNISSGSVQKVSWSTNETYTLELHLVQQTDNGWADVDTIFQHWHQEVGAGSYDWSVPQVVGPDRNVALWLSGALPGAHGAGYANITEWFRVFNTGDSVRTVGTTYTGKYFRPFTVGDIVGLALGCVAAFGLIIGGIVFVVLRKKRAQRKRQLMNLEGDARLSIDSIAEEKLRVHQEVMKIKN